MKYKFKVAANIEIPEFFEIEKYDIDEIKLHVSIERKDKKTSTSKALTIQPVGYTNIVEKINIFVQKALQNENVKSADYTNKKKGVMIVIDENAASGKIKLIEKYLSKISDDKGDLSVSEEKKVTLCSKKKKKSHTTKEKDLSKEEKTRAEIISINKNTTKEVSPTYLTFSTTLDILANNNNQTLTAPAASFSLVTRN
ncbi:hypothetical protein C1645_835701 [Glomus cerebriforme]|uniref:Uncharacterized protein n=1 Tax=Glomus cerebriforme TaxID=658196 RepID=A0A397S8C5_9GLOM|nr:hypothetical protein C1645_835701 [Glomus cerebriforme]